MRYAWFARGGCCGGVDGLTISSPASLVAKLAVNVDVSYMCQPIFDPTTGGLVTDMGASVFASLQERTGGKTVANGQGNANATAVCDEGIIPTPTVNHATVLVTPYAFFPASPPFKNGNRMSEYPFDVLAGPGAATGFSGRIQRLLHPRESGPSLLP